MNSRCNLADALVKDGSRMVAALRNSACYSHSARDLAVMETHISWVVLAGAYAYKIKKPVNMGFLDFSSLAARRYYCEEELRLNRRFAPDLYLEVVPITGEVDAPHVGGSGPVIEFAVKMRRFEQTALLDAKLARGELDGIAVEALARKIAAFHIIAPNALTTPGIDPAVGLLTPALENFRQMLPLLESADDVEALTQLRAWTLTEHQRPAGLLAKRLAEGRIRECHGDLHLGNIVQINGEPTPFDCIEFNPALRWIDVVSEVAFLVMDLEAHGRRDLAWAFLNTYLEAGGDYDGIAVLPFYLVYRALVRAKINLIRATQAVAASDQRLGALAAYRRYIALANSYTKTRRGAIAITHGLSGSGKTTLTQPAVTVLGALRIRSDIERKRLHGLAPLARTKSAVATGIYGAQATDRTYEQLARHARAVAGAGYPVIVDATFLKREQRAVFQALARELGVPFAILNVGAPPELLRERVAARAAQGGDASEATLGVLESQITAHEPLSADELRHTITIDAGVHPPAAARELSGRLIEWLRQ